MPTLAELTAAQAAATKAMAEYELPLHEEAVQILDALVGVESINRLNELAATLPESGAKNAIRNVAGSILAASSLMTLNLPRLRELAGVAPPPAPNPLAPPPEGGA